MPRKLSTEFELDRRSRARGLVNDGFAPKAVYSLLNWFDRNARDLPWRRSKDPYAIWVSETMLQQTQVKTVIPYWERWMKVLPTVSALANARPEVIHKLWEGLGYYTRVRNMHRAARRIVEVHGGRFPEMYDDVLALPGVGPYTAGALCSIAYNQPTPAVDGNVIRVLTRLLAMRGDPGKRTQKLWQVASRLQIAATAPSLTARRPATCSMLTQALMELGAVVCRPGEPLCGNCPVSNQCRAYATGRPEAFPQVRKRRPLTPRHFTAWIVERGGKVLVRQRPAGIVNGHLWEFPNVEITGTGTSAARAAAEHAGTAVSDLSHYCTIRHCITRYAITLDVFRCKGLRARRGPGAKWLQKKDLVTLAFPSAHRKVLDQLLAERAKEESGAPGRYAA